MARRLSLQGASEQDNAHLRKLLNQAGPNVRSGWRFYTGEEADLLIVDVDTVYGHMDWLRAHGSGNPVAVLTDHTRFEDADLILHKPVGLDNFVDVLERAAAKIADRGEPATDDAPPARTESSAPAPAPAPAPAEPAAAAAPEPPAQPPAEQRLAQWLSGSWLSGQLSLQEKDAPKLALDFGERQFYADGTLRALAPYCGRSIRREALHRLDAKEFAALQARTKAQPMSRLIWLCHVLGSRGHLADGLDINARYKLGRWPQIEREFPKHFRIATVMMKQPATLSEVAEQSGATLPDVIDFTNAYNAIGYIEAEQGGPADSTQRDSGRGAIMSRLRKPFGGN